MTPAELCRTHPMIGLDSNIFIYLFEDGELAALAGAVLDELHAASGRAVLAALGVAEILAGPAIRDDLPIAERYLDELRSLETLTLMPLSPEIAADSAVLRADRRRTLADTIHLATARAFGAGAFVTNDRRLRGTTKVEVIYLSDLELPPGIGDSNVTALSPSRASTG